MDIAVVQGNALTFTTDVLVLKYAQASYGVDAQVLGTLESRKEEGTERLVLPKPSAYCLVPSKGALGAKLVLFVGTVPLGDFQYAEIREFARRALAALAEAVPEAKEVAMTLHGVGFGLDEIEAFRAELAGIIEAVETGDHPTQLARVVIVDRDPRLVQLLQDQLNEIFPGGPAAIRRAAKQSSLALQSDELRTAGKESRDKAHVFVAMPFAKEFDDRFHYGIHTAIRAAGYLCERADMATFSGDVVAWVRERIDTAKLLVADLSGANPNVYLEVGYAWGRGKPAVLLASDSKDLLFDVRGQRCLVYEGSIRTLEEMLTSELKNFQ